MYKRILIANRADCALRLIRACRDLGIQTVAIAARDDDTNVIAQTADRIVYTGFSRDAYTSQNDILEAARHENCEALLPGWGFLSEDPAFAQKCRACGCHFVGPSTRQLQLFGDKLQTIRTLEHAFNPPQHPAIACDHPHLNHWIDTNDGPWMLKNRFGGGGKGIYLVDARRDLDQKLQSLCASKQLSHYYIEKACTSQGTRHIEFQFFGDGKGRVSLVGARDCTPQVHHQKWLEKSISLSSDLELLQIATGIQAVLQTMHYQSWGTVECLRAPDGVCQLLELNPRLQVEHGVTEMAANVDLVRAAIELSCYRQMDLPDLPRDDGEAIEFRLIALKSGTIQHIGFEGCTWPDHPCRDNPDYRIESAVMPNTRISGVYDGLCARFIVRAQNDALSRLKSWLKTFKIEGIPTTLDNLITG